MAAIAALALLFAATRTFVGILGMLLGVAWIAISAFGAFFILWGLWRSESNARKESLGAGMNPRVVCLLILLLLLFSSPMLLLFSSPILFFLSLSLFFTD